MRAIKIQRYVAESATKPLFALSSRFSTKANDLINFATLHNFDGIEYTVQAETSQALKNDMANMEALAASGFQIRYHLQFRKVELAHRNKEHAEKSLNHIKECIDVINALGGKHIIVHLCLGSRFALHDMKYAHAVKYLAQAADYAAAKDITACLENITYGFTNTPSSFLNLIKNTGVSATLDIGHVASSPVVLDGTITDIAFISEVAPYILSAHVYNIERFDEEHKIGVHIAPTNKDDMKLRLEALGQSNCSWYLIELGDPDEILRTAAYAREVLL
ncbi:MAG: sugar phosphate isomerase/epimerase [Gracilibacteraceae bacterium]|nr:sugar phosphate isomerase/epimerase [Gracilibacteraceae bacterium]